MIALQHARIRNRVLGDRKLRISELKCPTAAPSATSPNRKKMSHGPASAITNGGSAMSETKVGVVACPPAKKFHPGSANVSNVPLVNNRNVSAVIIAISRNEPPMTCACWNPSA